MRIFLSLYFVELVAAGASASRSPGSASRASQASQAVGQCHQDPVNAPCMSGQATVSKTTCEK